jgi:hypothetical protein
MIVIDAGTHFDHGKIIKCDFKLGSIERSIDLEDIEGTPQQHPAGNIVKYRYQ